MKHPFNYLHKFFFFTLIVSFSSCEKEEVTETSVNSNGHGFQYEEKSLEDFIADDNSFVTAYKQVISKEEEMAAKGKSYDFTINPNKVVKIENEGRVTYTMSIEKQDEAIGAYNNLVIEVEENKPAQAYILTYTPDAGGLKSANEHNSFSFEGTVTGFPIEYDTTDLVNSRQILVITVTYCNYGGSEHLAGGNCTPSYMYSISYVLSARGGGGIHVEEHQDPPSPGFGGGGGGGVPTVPVLDEDEDVVVRVDAVITALEPNIPQKLWLKGNTISTLRMFAFLAENHFSDESIALAKEAVEKFMNYTQTNYPGKAEGLPYKWWLEYNLNSTGDFFKMPSDLPNAPLEDPNAKELLLFSMFPDFAILHINNSRTAANLSYQLAENDFFSEGGGTSKSNYNGKSDAFRHAFWNALDTAEFGDVVTKLFTDAHEYEQAGIDVNMDLNNNKVGRDIANNYNFSFNTPDNVISNAIKQAVLNGELLYISPTSSNGSIIPTSILIPTNQ